MCEMMNIQNCNYKKVTAELGIPSKTCAWGFGHNLVKNNNYQ